MTPSEYCLSCHAEDWPQTRLHQGHLDNGVHCHRCHVPALAPGGHVLQGHPHLASCMAVHCPDACAPLVGQAEGSPPGVLGVELYRQVAVFHQPGDQPAYRGLFEDKDVRQLAGGSLAEAVQFGDEVALRKAVSLDAVAAVQQVQLPDQLS